MNKQSKYSKIIKAEALNLGFDDCGISAVQYITENNAFLTSWLEKGYNAGMKYLSTNLEKRADPSKLVEGAKSVISVILNYYTEKQQKDPDAPKISKYAYGKDYHRVVRAKLEKLLSFVCHLIPGTSGWAFVDSSPVFEKAWAQRSGLGWIGKNSLLLTPRFGSFVFIGELIVTAQLTPDKPGTDLCGDCRKCIDACPSGALVAEKILDARKCISYHTIEKKRENDNPSPVSLANYFYGCDICQNVCPWNQHLTQHTVREFNPHKDLLTMSKENWLTLNENRFNELFANTVVQRTGFERIKRNLGLLFP